MDIAIVTGRRRLILAFIAGIALWALYSGWAADFEIAADFIPGGYMAIALITACLLFHMEGTGWPLWLWCGVLVFISADMVWRMDQALAGVVSTMGAEQDALALGVALFTFGVLFVITRRVRLSLLLGDTLWFALGVANHLVYLYRGDAMLFGDLLAIGTATEVSATYDRVITGYVMLGILEFAALLALAFAAPRRRMKAPRQWLMRFGAFFICVIALFDFMSSDAENLYDAWMPQHNDYLYAFAVNFKLLNLEKPPGYSPDKVEGLTAQAREEARDANSAAVQTQQKPVIIAVMDESFSDLSVVGNVQTDTDYMPFIHSLSDNTIKGSLYVNIFGGGTCDTEYSFLTGNTTAFIPGNARPYQLYVRGGTPGLVSTLLGQGYTAHAIHPGQPDAWNRQIVYPNLGFSDFYSFPDFIADQSYSLTRGTLISDASTYDEVIRQYEQRGDTTPFIFDLTIANHGGYAGITEDLDPVYLQGLTGTYPDVETYLSLVRKSDEELESLVDYFKIQSQPVILVFFGDHQPNLSSGFYEEVSGKPLSDWSDADQLKRFQTPFVIWANYDIPEASGLGLSVNYLPGLVLQTAGLQETAYDQYQSDLSQELPVITNHGIQDASGNYYSLKDPGSWSPEITDFRDVVYNNLFDSAHRCEGVFELPALSDEGDGQQ